MKNESMFSPKQFWYGLSKKNGKLIVAGSYPDINEADGKCVRLFGLNQQGHRSYLLFCEYSPDLKMITEKVIGIFKEVGCNH